MIRIPFNKPYLTGRELTYIQEAHAYNSLAGDGQFTTRCHDWLEKRHGGRALLTHSATAALEMAALLLDIVPGDEIIMPSFTFVSTANAFVLRGGVPVFIDIRPDTLNIDERLVEGAITSRTRAIVVVHYAGVACEMNEIAAIAERHGLIVIEDAAQAVMADYHGRPLGSIGALAAFSFHETKNLISGEGGALMINDPTMVARAEVIREKGTDRSRFFRGEVDKYTWQDVGSSFLPGELIAAFLLAQLENAGSITQRRLQKWHCYHDLLAGLESQGAVRRPIIPDHCQHNAHIYYLLLHSNLDRGLILRQLRDRGIAALFHYVPLHSSPGGRRFGRCHGKMTWTDDLSARLIRLPLWNDITYSQQCEVCQTLATIINPLVV